MALRSEWLPSLAAFEAAARHQNFTHAAEELHLTASAVSHHVRQLESRLGVAVFQRHARGVSLTAEGRELADTTGSALADVEDVLRGLRTRQDNAQLVRVATLHSWTCGWLLPRLSAFTAAHPDIRLSIETGFAPTRFEEGGPDLGIRHGGGHWPGLTAQLLLHEDLFPVAAATLPGIDAIHVPADIVQAPLISARVGTTGSGSPACAGRPSATATASATPTPPCWRPRSGWAWPWRASGSWRRSSRMAGCDNFPAPHCAAAGAIT